MGGDYATEQQSKAGVSTSKGLALYPGHAGEKHTYTVRGYQRSKSSIRGGGTGISPSPQNFESENFLAEHTPPPGGMASCTSFSPPTEESCMKPCYGGPPLPPPSLVSFMSSSLPSPYTHTQVCLYRADWQHFDLQAQLLTGVEDLL